MPLENDLLALDWNKEFNAFKIELLKNVRIYRMLMYVFMGSSFILLFLFWIALFITLPAIAYFWYFSYASKEKPPIGILFTVQKKECWHRSRSPFYKADDPESTDTSYTFYLLFPSKIKYTTFKISETGLQKIPTEKIPIHFITNEHIFDSFEEGEQAFFIFTPINDLMAFYKNGKIIPLTYSHTLIDGEVVYISQNIKQETLKNIHRDGFELLKPGEKPPL
jgi:hypothetical protein